MVNLSPISSALVPASADSEINPAQKIADENYDVFQGDDEVAAAIHKKPESILRITMPHVSVHSSGAHLEEGSPAALEHASERMLALRRSELTQQMQDVLWIYQIANFQPGRAKTQTGIGGFVPTSDIRTAENPEGTILRNEGINPKKAEGRADIIRATGSFIGVVNLTVKDAKDQIRQALERYVVDRVSDLYCTDRYANEHRVWFIQREYIDQFVRLLAEEHHAYVADGNHRSAAAMQAGSDHFSAVLFPAKQMGTGPYNRLVQSGMQPNHVLSKLQQSFDVEPYSDDVYQPTEPHNIGLYASPTGWHNLQPKPDCFEWGNPVSEVDAHIVQRSIFKKVFGIRDAIHPRITYVGGNKDTAHLQERVNAGDHQYAFTLAPVPMDSFMRVCEAGRFMPPKSTWFDPKIHSGLVMADVE